MQFKTTAIFMLLGFCSGVLTREEKDRIEAYLDITGNHFSQTGRPNRDFSLSAVKKLRDHMEVTGDSLGEVTGFNVVDLCNRKDVYTAVVELEQLEKAAIAPLRFWGYVLYAFSGVCIIVRIILVCCKVGQAKSKDSQPKPESEDSQQQDKIVPAKKSGYAKAAKYAVIAAKGVVIACSITQMVLFAIALVADSEGSSWDVQCIIISFFAAFLVSFNII
jgi:hypothetical protein